MINEAAGDGDADVCAVDGVVVNEVAILKGSESTLDRVDQVRAGQLRAADPYGPGRTQCCRSAVEEEIALFDCPTVVAAEDDLVDLLDGVLADVGFNQIARRRIETEAVGIAQPVSVDFGNLARSLERVGRRNTVLAVAADGV